VQLEREGKADDAGAGDADARNRRGGVVHGISLVGGWKLMFGPIGFAG
jgi:hypothetical protein